MSTIPKRRFARCAPCAALALSVFTAPDLAVAESYGPPRPRGFAPSERTRLTGPIVGFENLFGYSSSITKTKFDDTSTRSVQSSLSFLGGGLNNPYALPGLSLDGVFNERLTLGAAMRYAYDDARVSLTVTSVSHTVLAGRVGLLFAGTNVGIWPRLGFAYQSTQLSTDTLGDNTPPSRDGGYTAGAFSVEVPVVLHGSWFGLGIGPAFYVPLGGGSEITTQATPFSPAETKQVDVSLSSFALVVSGYVFL